MHMQRSSSLVEPVRRALTVPVDRFDWLLGMRVSLAFVGPIAVAHVIGRGQADAGVIAFAGLLVSLVASGLPAGPIRRRQAPMILAAAPIVSLLYVAVPTHHPLAAAVMAVGCLAATLVPLRWPATASASAAAAMSLIMLPRFAGEPSVAILLLAGGTVALSLILATDGLRHPRLPLPALPTTRRAPSERAEMRLHALRLGVGIAVAATIALLAGEASGFTSRSSWMLLGLWIALQPQHGATRLLALQRGAGTAAGGLLTIAVALVMPSMVWIGWLFLLLTFVCFGLRSVNYAWYCIVLTPIVVFGLAGGPLAIDILAARVAWTIAGVVLAAVVRTVLWNRDVSAAVAPHPVVTAAAI
jgi:hypothetical protein